MRTPVLFLAMVCMALAAGAPRAAASELRLGIIGTDSSHAVEFTRILNEVDAVDHVGGARVVAAYRGGSPTLALSRDRIATFTTQLQNRWNVPFVEHIQDLCPSVDGLLLLSVDATTRQAEFEEAVRCGKPIFVDKPLAATLAAALAMDASATRQHVAWFSASAMRFGAVQRLRSNDVQGAMVWGPGALGEGDGLDLAWYGIHSIEMLYSVMGPGVKSVARTHTAGSDAITAVWADGRVGTVQLVRPDMSFGVAAFDSMGHATVRDAIAIAYAPLLEAVIAFVKTQRSPVSAAETLEVFAMMDAAQRSMQQGGAAVTLASSTTIRRPE